MALSRLLDEAPPDRVTLAWLMGRLGPRSFGLLVIVLALMGLAPGVAFVTGFVLALAALQMVLGYDRPRLPDLVATRAIPTRHFARWTERAIQLFDRIERITGRRPGTTFPGATRLVGALVLLLAVFLVWPIPLSHIVPTFVILLVAFAYLQGNTILLGISLVAAVLAVSTSAAMIWGAFKATAIVMRAWIGA